MKSELTSDSETKKTLNIELPSDVVDTRIDEVAKSYSRRVRIPGFRPGKAPSRVIKQRFKDQILHDVVHDLVPRAIDDAAREQGLEPVSQPEVRNVFIDEGKPLTFSATFDTLPPIEPGDYASITIVQPSSAIDDDAVERAMERLRERAAKFEPVEDRGVVDGDILTVDLDRSGGGGEPEHHTDIAIQIGASQNPPGFDAQLLGLESGAAKSFTLTVPTEPAEEGGEPGSADVTYGVTVKAIKRRVLPALDDEFAKDTGQFDTLDALRARVREDLEHEAKHAVERSVRGELISQLAKWVPYEVPVSLVEREIDRRLEEFAGRLMDQNVDPRTAGVDWNAFRESQREQSREAVASTLVLDAIARREQLSVEDAEVEQEIARYAERTGRTAAAVRAGLEKEGGLSRVRSGLRREKSIDFAMARARLQGA